MYLDLFTRGQGLNVPSMVLEHNTVAPVADTTYRHQWAMDVGYLGFECDLMTIFCYCPDVLFSAVGCFVSIRNRVLYMLS